MQLRGRTIGGTAFPSIPEVLENVFSYLDTNTLLSCRQVCKVWDDEACTTLGRRHSTWTDFAAVDVQWGGTQWEPNPSHVKDLRTTLTHSRNRQLFGACVLETSSQFLLAKELFVDFGSVLRSVKLNLGINFPLKPYVRLFDSLYKLVTDWGPNIQIFEIGLKRINSMVGTITQERYSPKFTPEKKTNIKVLDLWGIVAPSYPLFAMDLIQSSPKLDGLNMDGFPPGQWGLNDGPFIGNAKRTLKVLEMLTELPQITSRLNGFGYSFAETINQYDYFEPMCDQDAAITAATFGKISFGSLKKLSVDSCMLGGDAGSADIFKQVLRQNPGLETISIECRAQDEADSIIEDNNIIANPVILDVSLPLLTRLCLNTIKAKNIDLFSSLRHFPNLFSLEVRKRDPNHYRYDQDSMHFFEAEHSLKDSPHLCLKKLVYDYTFHNDFDFEAILDSFPNLQVLETTLYYGNSFLFGPDDIEDISPFRWGNKICHAFNYEADKLIKLKQLRIQSHQGLNTVEDWARALRVLKKLKGLGELIIDCRSLSEPSEYFDKIKKMVSKLSKATTDAVPVTVFPNTNVFLKLETDC